MYAPGATEQPELGTGGGDHGDGEMVGGRAGASHEAKQI